MCESLQAVSGFQGYRDLTTAAKAKERKTALKQCQQYSKMVEVTRNYLLQPVKVSNPRPTRQGFLPVQLRVLVTSRCYKYGKFGHFANKCPCPKQESRGHPVTSARTKQIHSHYHARRNYGEEVVLDTVLFS